MSRTTITLVTLGVLLVFLMTQQVSLGQSFTPPSNSGCPPSTTAGGSR